MTARTLTVTAPAQLPQGAYTYRVISPRDGRVTEFPIRRDFIVYLMRIDPIAHPSQHLGRLTVEETETGWCWVPPRGGSDER